MTPGINVTFCLIKYDPTRKKKKKKEGEEINLNESRVGMSLSSL